jgi:hypothetical protein
LTGLIPTSPSASCPNGGINLQAGADSNANGVLDQPEVTSSNVICNGKNGNSVLNGTSGPTNAAGIDGDFYLNTVALVLHGPKVNGTWPITGISLMGPTGATGA